MLTTHGACGRAWWQSGNRTSHCGGCHETFASLTLFDRHRHGGVCADPATMTDLGQPLATETRGGGGPIWYSPAAREAVRDAYQEAAA